MLDSRFGKMMYLAVCALPGAVLPLARVQAQDLPPDTVEKVKRATVVVLRGQAVPGKKDHRYDTGGSGCFLNTTGLVVTNNHVVDPGHGETPQKKLELRSKQGQPQYAVVVNPGTDQEKQYEAVLSYQSESADLALLQVLTADGSPLKWEHHLTLTPSWKLNRGDQLWSCGFPGLTAKSTRPDRHAEVSFSKGNIIRLPRSPGGRLPQIETDVLAAPGSSGGPQITSTAQILGVLSGGTFNRAAGSGVGVRTIPADLVVDMVRVARGRGKLAADADLSPFDFTASSPSRLAEAFDLAARLDIDHEDLREVAMLVHESKVEESEQRYATLFPPEVLKGMPKPLRDQAEAVECERLLRAGDLEQAYKGFRRLRRSQVEHVRLYAESRAYLLKEYEGKDTLQDPAEFAAVAKKEAELIIDAAREAMSAYTKATFDKNRDWEKAIKALKKHEEMLLIASCLAPGRGENDVYRSWRVRQELNVDEFIRLRDDIEELSLEISEFNRKQAGQSRSQRRLNHARITKGQAKLEKNLEEVVVELNNTHETLQTGGFRIDDPAAVDVLD